MANPFDLEYRRLFTQGIDFSASPKRRKKMAAKKKVEVVEVEEEVNYLACFNDDSDNLAVGATPEDAFDKLLEDCDCTFADTAFYKLEKVEFQLTKKS